jgi:hypothetical protein
VTFVHVTVPLTTEPGLKEAAKNFVKRFLGRPRSSRLDNVRRARYNELLREAYAGREPLFDLARLESTRPDGTRQLFREDGRDYEALVPAYTDDGGHLNASGRQMAARALLEFLASTPGARQPQ